MATKQRKLTVNLDDIADAMAQDEMEELSTFFDTESGEVVTISQEEFDIIEDIYQEHASFDEEPLDLAAILAESDYPEWQRENILQADQVEGRIGSRYIAVPESDTGAAYKDMVAFVPTVKDLQLQEKLERALEGRGAFRSFQDVLTQDRRTREQWFAFSNERGRERARLWLEFIGIEAIHVPHYVEDPSSPSPRQRLLEEVLLFVTTARQLPGLTRVALIGSLTTTEPDPDDADLLVTIEDSMNLQSLAELGRKLSGHAQTFNRGGEVFLADPSGNYLGRTCPWKQCEPFARMSCEAQNCGRRQYLYDDLQNLHLKKSLISKPPIELWPKVVTRVPVPEDLQEVVLTPLQNLSGED